MPAYTPIGKGNVVADFWLAAQVIDYWFEYEAERIPPPLGGPFGGPDAIEEPTRKLVVELGPTIGSPMIVADANYLVNVTGRVTKIAFKDLPDPFRTGQLPHLDLTGQDGGAYECTLPAASLDVYLEILKSGRPCYVQSDIADPSKPLGGVAPADVPVLKSYLHNR